MKTAAKTTSIKVLAMPASVREGFVAYVEPLSKDPKYDPYKPENFPQIRYALERKMWELLEGAPERDQAHAIMDAIKDLKDGDRPGFVIRGFPIDTDLPATPTSRNNHSIGSKGTISELATLAVLSLLDQEPFAVPGLTGGTLIQQISPRIGEEQNSSSGMGSKVSFRAHTDTSFIKTPPKIISLVCLKNSERAKTNLAIVDDIIAQFTDKEIAIMQEPIFEFSSGKALDYGVTGSVTAPILTYEKRHPQLRFNTAEARMKALTREGEAVVEKLNEVLDFTKNPDMDKGMIFEPGDAFFGHNGRCPHARTAFEPHEDTAKRRWVQRTLASTTQRNQCSPIV